MSEQCRLPGASCDDDNQCCSRSEASSNSLSYYSYNGKCLAPDPPLAYFRFDGECDYDVRATGEKCSRNSDCETNFCGLFYSCADWGIGQWFWRFIFYIIKVVLDVLLLGLIVFLVIYLGYKLYMALCGGGEDAEDLETEDQNLLAKTSKT